MVRKFLIGLMIFITLFNVCSNVFALELTSANIVQVSTADNHLKYNRGERGYTYLKCSVVGYYKGSEFKPAYCMNRDLDGAEKRSI